MKGDGAMADKEMIAAVLAASVSPRADFYHERDLRNSVERSSGLQSMSMRQFWLNS